MKILAFLLLFFCRLAFADPVSVKLEEVRLIELFRLVHSEILRKSFVIDNDALMLGDLLTVDWTGEPRQIDRELKELLAVKGFSIIERNGVRAVVKTPDVEKIADSVVIYRPKFRSVSYLTDIGSIYGRIVSGGNSVNSNQSMTMQPSGITNSISASPSVAVGASASQGNSASMVQVGNVPANNSMTVPGEKTPRDVVAMAVKPADRQKLLDLLVDLDVPIGEIVLKAIVYEVGTGRDEGSALQLALAVSGLTVQAGGVLKDSSASFKISAGGLDVLAAALDSDARFKSISKPHVRVASGASARFSVGSDVPVLGAATLDRNGNPIQSVEYRSSGVILSVQPEVREEIIEMQVNQELSNFVVTSTGVNTSPTLTKRSVSSRLTLKPGEVVALAGLQDDQMSEKESRIPFLGWMFSETKTAKKNEVIVFLEAKRI